MGCRRGQQKPDHIHLFTHPFINSFILSGLGQRGKWPSKSQGLDGLKGVTRRLGRGHGEGLAQRSRGEGPMGDEGEMLGQHLETALTVGSGQRGSLFWRPAGRRVLWGGPGLGRRNFLKILNLQRAGEPHLSRFGESGGGGGGPGRSSDQQGDLGPTKAEIAFRSPRAPI